MYEVNQTPTFELDRAVPEGNETIVPNSIYSDGMCLQRERVLCIRGKTSEQAICAELNGEVYYGTVEDGQFRIALAPQQAGGPYSLTIYGKTAKLTIKQVYIGEVFLCSGQSNMEIWMSQCASVHYDDIVSADNNQIRLLSIPKETSQMPLETIDDLTWNGAQPESVAAFSCVAYLFGREMQERLNVPIGLVNASWGGSIAAFWMPESKYQELCTRYDIYTISGTTEFTPCLGYNGMIAPIRDYGFRSVLWYQGESNGNPTAEFYDKELEGIIAAWRNEMSNNELGFTIIELPRYSEATNYWATIREKQQLVAQNDPLVCMSVSIDLGDWGDIHPQDKTLFAHRAAEGTLQTLFNVDNIQPYPTVLRVERISDKQVRIVFDGVGDGITVTDMAIGFETSANGSFWTMIADYDFDENSITITGQNEIVYLRYGYRCIYTQVDYQGDVSNQVSVWNSFGNPLDQFCMKIA